MTSSDREAATGAGAGRWVAVLGLVLVAGFGVAGCGREDADVDTSVADVREGGEGGADSGYEGVYDDAFEAEVTSYDGETVEISAQVAEVVSAEVFTLAGDEPGIRPLLVAHEEPVAGVAEGDPVTVSGTVHRTFDITNVEEEVSVDLDDALFEDFEAEPYIEATDVEVSQP